MLLQNKKRTTHPGLQKVKKKNTSLQKVYFCPYLDWRSMGHQTNISVLIICCNYQLINILCHLPSGPLYVSALSYLCYLIDIRTEILRLLLFVCCFLAYTYILSLQDVLRSCRHFSDLHQWVYVPPLSTFIFEFNCTPSPPTLPPPHPYET